MFLPLRQQRSTNSVSKKEHKTLNINDKALAIAGAFMLYYSGCGMIALIRKVAAERKNISVCRFLRGANVKTNRWRQVTVPNLGSGIRPESGVHVVRYATHPTTCTVTTCLTKSKSTKRRRLFLWQNRL